jgi:iron complex transport system substrate-binding protein
MTRIFPAGPPAAILLYTLAPDLLIGWPRANRPEECVYMLPEICMRPAVGRITGRGNTANLETVLALKPDLILDIGSVNDTYISLADRVQQQTGIPYALLDGRFVQTADAYQILGRLVGHQRSAADLADYCSHTLTTITGRIADVPREQRPRLYYARGPRGLQTGGKGSINVETAELLARNVADELPGGLANVSLEQVLLWDPDVIVTIDRDFAASARSDPTWRTVRAVRNGRVFLSPSVPFGWIDFPPSVNRLIGLWWLAKILYPDKFPEDMTALTREFYSKFYHVTPTDAQIAQILSDTA